MLGQFRYSRFSFVIETIDELVLPEYKGATFRGGFGYTFRRLVCLTRQKECTECLMQQNCIYSYVFETPPPEGDGLYPKNINPAKPFVIEPPNQKTRVVPKGTSLSFGLVLIGKALEYLPYFIYTFSELGQIGLGKGRGKYKLVKVLDVAGQLLYNANEGSNLKNNWVVLTGDDSFAQQMPEKLTISFVTPTRFRHQGQLSSQLDFSLLMRNVFRRLSALAYYHCSFKLDLDFIGLLARSQEIKMDSQITWYDWTRYSSRQKEHLKMGGFVGQAICQGSLGEFMPYLRLCEDLHIGKGCAFGLGHYKLIEEIGGKN